MKYHVLFGLAAFALGFTACDDIEESDSLPQENPQLEIVSSSNVTVNKGSAASSTIDLAAANASNTPIAIATVAAGEDWPEGFTPLVNKMEFSALDDFSSFATIDATTSAEGVVTVGADAFDEAYKSLFGKNPNARNLFVRFPVIAVNGKQSIRMGGEDTYYGNFGVTVKPFDLFNGQVVEDAYYLISNVDNWDFSKAHKFSHGTTDVYDDPVFTLSLIVEGAGYEWAIIPASTYAAGSLGVAYGVTDASASNGALVQVPAGQTITYGVISSAAPCMFTINMLDLTYDVKAAYEKLYTPGNSNGWNQGASQVLTTSDYVMYTGYAHLNGEFKFCSQADWSGTNYGNGGEGKLTTDGAAGNLNAPADALYFAQVNLPELTYSLTAISTYGLIGDATPGGWDNSTPLTPSADFLTWTATVQLGDGSFKFRANDGWDYNLGGALDALTAGGDNIPSPGAGTYVVTLDFSAVPYTATLTKQ